MQDLFEKFYVKAAHFLKHRPRSEKELRDNLKKKSIRFRHIPSTDIAVVVEKVIQTLKEQQFLDDSAFANWWIEQRSRFRPRSIRVLQLELRQKGVDQEIIDEVFYQLEQPVSNQEMAKKIVEKKLPRLKNLPKEEIYKKLGGSLARKGFDWETIKTSIDEALK
jgi:regulatory protein